MKVFVVVDTKGDGRLVGVFDREEKANAVQRVNPHYFRVHAARLNDVNPAILSWALNEKERRCLARLVPQGSVPE